MLDILFGYFYLLPILIDFCMFITEFVFAEKETWKAIKPDYLASWTLICAFFVLVFNFVLLET